MARGCRPTLCRMRCLDRVSDILSVRDAHLTKQGARFAVDRLGIAAIRSRLLTTDIELRGPVQRIARAGIAGEGQDCFQSFWLSLWLGVGPQAFPTAFASKAAFADAAETRRGVEHVGPIHPDDASRKFRRYIKGQIDVLGPERSGEAVSRIICKRDGFGWCAEGRRDQNGAKDLFLHQRVGRI